MAATIDTSTVREFVRSWLPPPPATALEVGAGTGDFARELIDDGYDVTPIDPVATDDMLVRALTLEEFNENEQYDVVVASRSLHHIHDLEAAVSKIHGFLDDDGYVILNGFGWDRLDEPTGRWLYSQLREQESQATGGRDEESFSEWFDHWRAEHADLHRSDEMLDALRDRFTERYFAECPYLVEEYVNEDPEIVHAERRLITDSTIQAAGFRFVGQPDRES